MVEERIRSSRWIAVLLSKESLKTRHMMEVWLSSIINQCIEDNQLRVVVLLRGLDPEYLPDFIQWVTYVDIKREKNHVERIMGIVQGLLIYSLLLKFVLYIHCVETVDHSNIHDHRNIT